MNGLKRFINWIKALFNRGMDKLEDPEMMLDQARRDMTEVLIENREKAVQAIAARNNLQRMVDEAKEKSERLENNAVMALKSGNRELAKQFMGQKALHDKSSAGFQTALENADSVVDSVKVAIKRQEEQVRVKTAEALALKAQWKQAQIQNSITKALDGLTFDNEYEGAFAQARDRVSSMQAEASARAEMHAESLQGKTWELESQAADSEADQALAELEQRLGLGTTVEADTEVAAELEKLEQHIATNGMPTTPDLAGLGTADGGRAADRGQSVNP